jgi:hypothetical protein
VTGLHLGLEQDVGVACRGRPSLATHLAGSTKYTRVSFRLVIARIRGYRWAVTFSYGE